MTTPTNLPAGRASSPLGRRLAALLSAGALLLAACGDDDTGTATSDDETSATTAAEATDDSAMADDDAMAERDEAMADGEAMADDDAMAMVDGEPSGPGCEAVPTDGEGSFEGMADDPAATAASANPVLSTLVTAVQQAELVDTLNSDGPFTIFAPTNDAFAALPADQLDAVLADNDLLTSVLTFHVVAGEKLSSADLVEAGSATTVNGADLTFEAAGDRVMVNGAATTVCQDVPTANATVHIIDTVLVPEG